MNATKSIQKKYNEIQSIASKEVKRLVLIAFKKNKNLKYFYMGMGTYFFEDAKREQLSNYKNKKLDDFISEWDQYISITGEYMELTN